MKLNLGFLASGNGSNFKAIHHNIHEGNLESRVCVLVSDNPFANALRQAQGLGVINFCINENNPDELIEKLKKYDVNLVLLCGYIQKIPEKVIDAFPNRILNIHPALLPKYSGKGMYGYHVHEAVIASSDTESGATVHIVDKEYDNGKILSQARVPRYSSDTPESLGKRVLRFEHALYSNVLDEIKKGIIKLD